MTHSPPFPVQLAHPFSEQHYHPLVASAPQLMWLNQADGTVICFSQRWYEYTGTSPEDMAEMGWLNSIHLSDRDGVAQERAVAIADGRAYEIEMRIRQADGVFCWHYAQVVPLRNEDGLIVAWTGVAIEIDKRKRAEEALQLLAEAGSVLAQSLDYETTLQSVARLVVPRIADYCLIDVVQEDGQIMRVAAVHADPAKQLLVGQARRFPPMPNSQSPLFRVLATGTPEFEAQVSGEWIKRAALSPEHAAIIQELNPHSVMVVPLLVRHQAIGALSLVSSHPHWLYDETDLALAQNLAGRAAQAIDNARLYEQAQTAIREREAFISIASHELKNPLSALYGQAQLLQRRAKREGTLQDRDQRSLDTVVDQAVRLNGLLDELLDVSRLEHEQLALDRRPLDVVAVTQRLAEETQTTLTTHALRLELPPYPIMIKADQVRIEQAVRNLISNAIKYSPTGTTITVLVTQEHERVALAVQDQGYGIASDALPHIFERFYRVEGRATRSVRGFGIGLYVVKEIVTLHDGTVKVDSQEGRGSTFTVYLPMEQPAV